MVIVEIEIYTHQIECADAHANAAFEMHSVNIVSPLPIFQDRHAFPARDNSCELLEKSKTDESSL